MCRYPEPVSDAARLAVAAVLLLAALALAVVAVLALTGRLRRNRWAGVRTPATLAGAEAFTVGNRVAAPPVLAAAVLLFLAAVAEFSEAAVAPVAMVLCVAGAAALVVVGGVLGNRAATVSGCAPDRCADCTGCELMDSLN